MIDPGHSPPRHGPHCRVALRSSQARLALTLRSGFDLPTQVGKELVKPAGAARSISARRLQRIADRGQPPLEPRSHRIVHRGGFQYTLRR
jgi:hypothetical protein